MLTDTSGSQVAGRETATRHGVARDVDQHVTRFNAYASERGRRFVADAGNPVRHKPMIMNIL
jgi:hypothetical protein